MLLFFFFKLIIIPLIKFVILDAHTYKSKKIRTNSLLHIITHYNIHLISVHAIINIHPTFVSFYPSI